MKVLTIIGARPQFIKAAPVSRALKSAGITEILLHTGQHYDPELSQVFFDELGLKSPDYNLNIGSGSHAWQTGQMMLGIEAALLDLMSNAKEFRLTPIDWVLVYGDTNSTLAGALAAVKLGLPVVHVEAGLRSFNRQMPEEHNRVLTDHCADLLCCPTQNALENLRQEGLAKRAHRTGDVMFDAVKLFCEFASSPSKVMMDLNLFKGDYNLATIHRAYNADQPERLFRLLEGLARLDRPVILPLHPRTRTRLVELGWIEEHGSTITRGNIIILPPIGYLEMLSLEQNAHRILTDSGGVQKEAFFFAVPCITLRPETEWIETVQSGWNQLVDVDPEQISFVANEADWPRTPPPSIFGDGNAAQRIVELLTE